jgi:hypothetical protein
VLNLGGVVPPVRVTQGHTAGESGGVDATPEVFNYEKSVHRLAGGGMVIGCVVNSYMDGVNNDWGARNDTGAILFGQSAGATIAAATLQLETKVHMYDTRNAEYLGGPSTQFNVQLPVYEGAVFTALPYEVTAVRLDVEHVDDLQKVTLSAAVRTDGPAAQVGTHVLLLTVAAADGTKLPLLTRKVVASGGAWTGIIPFGAGEALAGVAITARDVATGKEGDVVLRGEPLE